MRAPETPTAEAASTDRPATRDPGGDPTVGAIRRRLLDHYDRSRRPLPWRAERRPYPIWVSEVMLQQTRVETVIPYYRRWMGRFPDLEALAAADEDEVLELWQGLGYYARARNLHRAARVIRDRHGGELPGSPDELRRLPGFGSYTAGAVASIAFGAAVPAVDGNVRRVLSRLLDLASPTAAQLASVAGSLVDPERPGDFNQALMELGATICVPRTPRCGGCPLQADCLAAERGTTHERPARRRRAPVPERSFVVVALVDPLARTLLVRRPRGGLLGGMWSLPERELEHGASADAARVEALALAQRQLGGPPTGNLSAVQPLPELRHAFTHLRARYLPWRLRLELSALTEHGDESRRWVPAAAPGLPLPTAQRRILEMVHDDVAATRTVAPR